jgi:hypothetical protein
VKSYTSLARPEPYLARLRELYKNLAISQRELDQAASDQQTARKPFNPHVSRGGGGRALGGALDSDTGQNRDVRSPSLTPRCRPRLRLLMRQRS